MTKYRFKTEEEFKQSGLWDIVNGTPVSWNKNRLMNHLMGKDIPTNYHGLCRAGEKFIIEDFMSPDRKWNITSMHYTSYESEESVLPQQFSRMEQSRRESLTPGPMFDIGRLSKEIDDLFDKKLTEAVNQHSEITTYSLTSAKAQMTDYLKKVKDTFKDIREELLAEVSRGRTTIVLSESQHIDIRHMDHPKMEDVIKSLHLNHKAMLVGPAGTGKTYMVAEIAERMKLPFYKYSCSRDSSVHDLLGYKQPRSEEYLNTVFLQAYEEGGIFLVDEYDAMSGDMSLFFNGIADNSKFISVPHRDVKPIAKKHKDFYLIMCGNTWGKGSIEFSGRDFQDQALMDRFRLCRHHIGYHESLEKQWMGSNYPFAKVLRDTLEKQGTYLSTRNIEDISNMINSGVSKKDIVTMLSQDLDSQGKEVLTREMSRQFGI